MYIVSSVKDGAFNGQVVNTVFQTTGTPPMIAVCINRANLTHEFVSASGKLAVSVLTEEAPMTFIGKFGFKSGRAVDKFRDTRYKLLASGCPAVLDYSLGYMEAVVRGRQENGQHTLFSCEVTGEGITGQGKPMTYDHYHQVKKGLTPQAAPTFAQRKE